MSVKDKKLIELYEFALKYARVCRSHCLEVDEAVNEMMLVVLQMKGWKSVEYAKQMMRNRMMDLFRHESVARKAECPLGEDTDALCVEENKWDAKLMVEDLLKRSSATQARTLKCLLQGRTIQETARRTRTNRRTITRHISKARELMLA